MKADMNRETWLNEMAKLMSPRFEELGFPLPKFRVSIGFTSTGANGGANGQCWSDVCTKDKHYSIFISPSEETSLEIAAILNHELIHAAVGLKEGHKGKFQEMMKSTGMARPFTSSIAGDGFTAWVKPFIDKLGEIPHSQLMVHGDGAKLFKKEVGGVEAVDDEPVNNLPKKQTTRMLKATCKAIAKADGSGDGPGKPCGYTVRLSKKWAKELGACCPVHGGMDVEGVDDDDHGEDEDAE